MHIRSCQRDVAQCGYTHRLGTGAVLCECRFSSIALVVAPGPGEVETRMTARAAGHVGVEFRGLHELGPTRRGRPGRAYKPITPVGRACWLPSYSSEATMPRPR